MNIVLVAHDIRSTHNVGAFFRTCDALGVRKIIFSGYTPYPKFEGDTRIPHFADKITRQIHKTALGAETSVAFEHFDTLDYALAAHKSAIVVALEQAEGSLTPFEVASKIKTEHQKSDVILVVGNEVHGVNTELLESADYIMEIPMYGSKESLNVSVATGIALYELTKPT